MGNRLVYPERLTEIQLFADQSVANFESGRCLVSRLFSIPGNKSNWLRIEDFVAAVKNNGEPFPKSVVLTFQNSNTATTLAV